MNVDNDIEKAAKAYAFTYSGEDEVLKYEAFKAGAEWQKNLLSDKACEWFYEQLFEGTMECKNIEALITDFKIKMEE